MTSPENPYGQPVYSAAPAPRKSKKKLWVGLGAVAVGALLCCGVGSAIVSSAGTEKPQAAPSPTKVQTSAPQTSAPLETQPVSEPEPVSAPTEPAVFDLKLGTSITVETDSGAMQVVVKRSAKYPKPRAAACKEYMSDPSNGYYMIFDVTMKVTKGTGSINPLYFTYVAPDGATDGGMGGMFSGCGKALDSGNDMRAGTVRSGQLVFDVPSAKGSVEFGGSFFGGTQASWKVG